VLLVTIVADDLGKVRMTMDGHREQLGAQSRTLPPTNVRVLTSDEELAAAVARAEEGAKRLHDRLAARAARDAWMAEHNEQRVGWKRFVRGPRESAPPVSSSAPGPRRRVGDAAPEEAPGFPVERRLNAS
jgi:hypothetical protein